MYFHDACDRAVKLLVSFAAAIQAATQRPPPTNGRPLELRIPLVTFAAKGPGFQEMEACSLLVNPRKGMQRPSEQPPAGEERHATTQTTAAKETIKLRVVFLINDLSISPPVQLDSEFNTRRETPYLRGPMYYSVCEQRNINSKRVDLDQITTVKRLRSLKIKRIIIISNIYPRSSTHSKWFSGRSCIRSNWNRLGVNF